MFILLISAPFVREVFEPRFYSNYDFYFEKNDPVLLEYQKFVKDFNVKEQAIIIFQIDQLFTNEGLEALYKTTNALRNIDKVAEVTSLSNFRSLVNKDGTLELTHLIPSRFDLTTEELSQVKERVLKDPWVKGKFLFKDGQYVGTFVDLQPVKSVAEKTQIMETVKAKINANFPEKIGKYYLLGTPIAEASLEETVKIDNQRFLVFMPIVVSILVVLLVRNLFASIILVANVFITAGWIVGLMYHTGQALNPITQLIMPTLIATGIAEGIHIVTHFLDLMREEGKSYKEAVIKSMNELWLPTIMTGMTSIVGYMSFLSSDIFPVKLVGVYMTVGLAVALFMTLVFIPALFLGLAPLVQKFNSKGRPKLEQIADVENTESPTNNQSPAPNDHERSVFENISRWILSYPKSMLAGIVVASSVMIFGMTKLKIDTNIETFLPEEGEVRKNIDFVEKNVGNYTRYEVVLYMEDDHDDFANPKSLAQVENFRTIVSDQFTRKNEIDSSWSAYDLIKVVNQTVNGKDEIPPKRTDVLELIELADQGLLGQMMTPSMRAMRVSFLANFKEASQKIEFINTVQQASQLVFSNRVRAVTVSIPMLYFWIGERVFQTQVSSFSTAFLPIFLMMSIIGGGMMMGIISMLPNILPIFMLFGIMGWFGISLDTATAMIASIVIGIAVDDTVHFLHRYGTYTKKGYGRVDAIAKTFAHCGKASLFTSMIVAFGFLGLVTSSINPTRMFGALTAVAMLIGVLCEIFVLPLALYFLDYKTPRETSTVSLHVHSLKAREKEADGKERQKRSS